MLLLLEQWKYLYKFDLNKLNEIHKQYISSCFYKSIFFEEKCIASKKRAGCASNSFNVRKIPYKTELDILIFNVANKFNITTVHSFLNVFFLHPVVYFNNVKLFTGENK